MRSKRAQRFEAAPAPSELPPGGTENVYRYMIDSVTEYAIFIIGPTGIVETWNRGAQSSFGYAASEIVGRPYDVFFTTDDCASGAPEYELSVAEAEGRIDIDRWHVRKDGSRFWGTNTVQPLRDAAGTITAFTKIVRDTTEQHEAAEALRRSEERLRLLVESVTHYAIFSVSPQRRITLWNAGAQHVFGYAAEEIVGTSYDRLFTEADAKRGVPQRNLDRASAHVSCSDERWLVRKDGARFFATGKLTQIRDTSDEAPRGFVSVAHDVTERKKEEEQLRHEACHDALTGLPNRSLFVEHVRRTIAHSQRLPHIYFAVFFLDVDRFKLVNDSLGHAFADQVLIRIGERLAGSLRGEDVVARIGGDEFAILASDLHEPGEAVTFAERLHVTLAAPFHIEGYEIFASASVGIVIGDAASATPEQLLRDADTAMYAAKSRGRAHHVVFDKKMHENVVALHTLETDLRYAVKRNELRVAYQPIVALTDGHIVGFEALVRWNHPCRGTLAPDEFISAAEDTGLVIGIDRWVLREACREIADWNRRHAAQTPLSLSVNFSSKQFVHSDLVEHIERVLEQTRMPAGLLNIEITENVLMERSPAIDAILAALRALGIEIHIDDFGTGYSSLSYLRYLPVNVLKIDRSFVSTMLDDVDSFQIVRSIVDLSANLRLEAMAEGVETCEQLAALRQLNCRYAQGYLFSSALPWSAASALATERQPYVFS